MSQLKVTSVQKDIILAAMDGRSSVNFTATCGASSKLVRLSFDGFTIDVANQEGIEVGDKGVLNGSLEFILEKAAPVKAAKPDRSGSASPAGLQIPTSKKA